MSPSMATALYFCWWRNFATSLVLYFVEQNTTDCPLVFLIKSKREQSLLNLTAQQHYVSLFKERSELLSVVPLKYISSYIGVTPQALSRIRKRIY